MPLSHQPLAREADRRALLLTHPQRTRQPRVGAAPDTPPIMMLGNSFPLVRGVQSNPLQSCERGSNPAGARNSNVRPKVLLPYSTTLTRLKGKRSLRPFASTQRQRHCGMLSDPSNP